MTPRITSSPAMIASPQTPYRLPCLEAQALALSIAIGVSLGPILNASIGTSIRMSCTRQKPIAASAATSGACSALLNDARDAPRASRAGFVHAPGEAERRKYQ